MDKEKYEKIQKELEKGHQKNWIVQSPNEQTKRDRPLYPAGR